jgi:hypothetical protein
LRFFDENSVGPDVLIRLILAVDKPNLPRRNTPGLRDMYGVKRTSVDSTNKHELVFDSLEFEAISVRLGHRWIRTAIDSLAPKSISPCWQRSVGNTLYKPILGSVVGKRAFTRPIRHSERLIASLEFAENV